MRPSPPCGGRSESSLVDPFRSPDDDPFQAPSPGQDPLVAPDQGDPRIGPSGVLSETPPTRSRKSVVVITVVVLGVVIALFGAGNWIANGLNAASESREGAANDPGQDLEPRWWETAVDYPSEITDLDALTAEQGDSFGGMRQVLRAMGTTLPPGIYVASGVGADLPEADTYCSWTVSERDISNFEGFHASGLTMKDTAMVLLPRGYSISSAPACGRWEAIDPATALESATETEWADGTFFVGYDVVPGLYLSDGSVDEGSECRVSVTPHFGFTNPNNRAETSSADGGTMMLTVEAGDVVLAEGCPAFTLADSETVLEDGAGG